MRSIPSIFFCLVLSCTILLPAHLTTAESSDSQCSSRPDISDCRIVGGDPISLEVNDSIHWQTIRPYGLRTFYLLKTNPDDMNLMTSSIIRWRLPYLVQPLPQPVEGFLVTVSDSETGRKIGEIETHLTSPIVLLDKDIVDIEYFIESLELFEFGTKHRVEVSILPRGIFGSSKQLIELPQRPRNDVCNHGDESEELAKRWSVHFETIRLLVAPSAINISFLSAPTSLCIDRYSVQVHSRTGPLVMEYVIDKMPSALQYHVFNSIPRDTELMVKVGPAVSSDGTCPCAGCNCITSKSEPFTMPLLVRKELVPVPPPIHSQEQSFTGYGTAFLVLLVVLAVSLCGFTLLTVTCLLNKRNRILMNRINRLQHTNSIVPLVRSEKAYRILLVAAPGSDEETKLVDELARLLAGSHHSVIYDRFEWNVVEANVHAWLLKGVREADKILIVHPRTRTNGFSSNVFDMLTQGMSVQDERSIYIKLHKESSVDNRLVETVFLLSRDVGVLCAMLQIPFGERWRQLETKCRDIYCPDIVSSCPETPRIIDIEPVSEMEENMTNEIDAENNTDIFAKSDPTLGNHSRDSGFEESTPNSIAVN